jgi:hypothetical protein
MAGTNLAPYCFARNFAAKLRAKQDTQQYISLEFHSLSDFAKERPKGHHLWSIDRKKHLTPFPSSTIRANRERR